MCFSRLHTIMEQPGLLSPSLFFLAGGRGALSLSLARNHRSDLKKKKEQQC